MNQLNTLGFVDPRKVVEQLPLVKGERVADFGCGAGFFSCAFAEAVGQEGHVTALDILPTSLEAVMSRARTTGLTNITTARVNLEREGGSGLDPHSLDWVIIKDMLFQNKNKGVILYEAARVLHEQGRLFIMEWEKDTPFVGPENSLRIDRTELEVLLADAGFVIEKSLQVGEYHYAYLAKKQA